jgi:hypothetical protein
MYGGGMLMYGNYSVLFHTRIFIANLQINVCNNEFFTKLFFFLQTKIFLFYDFFITEKFYFNYLNINTVLFFYLNKQNFYVFYLNEKCFKIFL